MKFSESLARQKSWWRIGVPLLVGGSGLVAISWAENASLIDDPTKEFWRIPAWFILFVPLLFVTRDYSKTRVVRRVVWAVLALVLVWRILYWTDELEALAQVPLLGSESEWQSLTTQLLSMLAAALALVIPLMLCEELEQEQRLLRRVLEVQEKERQTTALDLHDGLVQYCVGAKLMVDTYRKQSPTDRLEAVSEHLDNAIAEGRRLISECRHPVLDESGIEEAIRHRASEVAIQIGANISTDFATTCDMSAALSGNLYRIAHEALTNIQRHSQAKQASVSLRQIDQTLHLDINDDGCGFRRADVAPERFGLKGMEERARLMGGKTTIKSAPGQGTRIQVAVPCDGAYYR